MKLRLVPPRQGVQWVLQGFRVFFRQPLAFAGLFVVFMFTVALLSMLPWIGPLLLLALLPLATLGFMIATRAALAGRFSSVSALLEPLRGERTHVRALVQLGIAYMVASVVIMWLSDVIDGGALDTLMATLTNEKSTPEEIGEQLADGRLQAGLLARVGLATLLSVPFWHAPALVHWDGQRCAQSLFSSTIAVWRNRGAFALFGAVWGAVIMGFALLANIVLGLLGLNSLLTVAAMPASLIFSTVFYASLYFTFVDCFELPGSAEAKPHEAALPIDPPASSS